ncbi:MAG: hypothetical protein RR766_05350, partial [Longicatena sp.]
LYIGMPPLYQIIMGKEVHYAADNDELDIFKRGRNYKSDSVPKNTDVTTYRTSTGFEAVLGYWYVEKKNDRLNECWDKVRTFVEV